MLVDTQLLLMTRKFCIWVWPAYVWNLRVVTVGIRAFQVLAS